MRASVAFAIVVAASSFAATAWQEMPRFRSGVDVVQFTVTVLDKARRPVTGLTASDFAVLVDGKPQPLAAFAAVTLPDDPSVTAASIPPVAPDVHTNQLPAEGRLVVIVMDRSIRDNDMPVAHAIANAAISRLGPNDLGAVVYTSRSSRKFSQGLTDDRQRLHAAVNQLSLGDLTAEPGVPSLAAAIASRGAPQKIDQLERAVPLTSAGLDADCPCGVCVIDGLTALAKSLGGAMGREKSILFVGSDIAIASQVARTDLKDAGGYCEAYIYPARDKLTRALDAANVTFHVIDPHGIDPLEGIVSFRVMSLGVLPDYTGGRTVIINKPEEKIGAIFDESRSYYVLAVARDPAISKEDDQHRIKIGVKRSDAIVNARNVYFAADPKARAARAPTAAAGALNELLPGGDFSLQMNLVSQFGKDGSPEIRVLLGVDSAVAGKLDVLIRAYDHVFTPVAAPLKQRLDVPAAAVAGAATFQWASTLKPPPGDYEVRAAVATADGKHAANVIGYVDVPDVQKAGLALSGIVVTSGGAPTVRRGFVRGDAVGLSFQVARAKNAPMAASVRYVLRDEIGQTLASMTVPHERAVPVTAEIERYDIGLRMPAAAGRYILRIEASDGKRATSREVPVIVR
jgi:VWFA-related protein